MKSSLTPLLQCQWTELLFAFAAGFVTCIILAIGLEATPMDMRNNMRQSAIKAGVGHWTLDTNGYQPVARFEWVKLVAPILTNAVTVNTNKP